MAPRYNAFSEAEHRERLARARHAMREFGIDACISIAPETLFYLGGYDSWVAANSPQALIFSADAGEPSLIVRDVDQPLAAETSWITDIRTYRLHRDKPENLIAGVIDDLKANRVGIEMQTSALPYALGSCIARVLAPATLIDITECLGALRWIKSARELAYMREAAAYVHQGLATLKRELRVGISEMELTRKIENAMRRAGSDYWAIPTELASGDRSEGGHATPRERIINSGELVHAEFAGVRARYHVVGITTGCTGEPSVDARELHALACRSLQAGLSVVRPGVSVSDVEEESLKPLRQAGLEDAAMMRFGYGIGIAYPPVWLETLQISRGVEQRLESDMTFVLHACLTPPGSRNGVILGGTWLMTDEGCEMLAGTGTGPLLIPHGIDG